MIGSHAVVYTEAARAWLEGGDPWSVGPPAVVFSGPPPMLLPFVPFVVLPDLAVRVTWVLGSAALAIWTLRRLRLAPYWLAYPPMLEAIVLGHPEMLVLTLLVAGGTVSGLAAIVKPYAGFPLLAERRWRALVLAVVVALATLPILPWPRFLQELPTISANLVRQSHGDSVFGDPVMMVVAVLALATLGWRRALWLVTPVLWPSAQPGYKLASVPAMSPILAVFWAMPIAGATLAGLVVEAVIVAASRIVTIPGWLAAGTTLGRDPVRVPASIWPMSSSRAPEVPL